MSYTVKCRKCDARGPHVVIKDTDYRIKEKDREKAVEAAQIEAIDRWNELGDK